MDSLTYNACRGYCSSDLTDIMIVEAFYETPTLELAASVVAILATRGYKMTPQELIDEMYD